MGRKFNLCGSQLEVTANSGSEVAVAVRRGEAAEPDELESEEASDGMGGAS